MAEGDFEAAAPARRRSWLAPKNRKIVVKARTVEARRCMPTPRASRAKERTDYTSGGCLGNSCGSFESRILRAVRTRNLKPETRKLLNLFQHSEEFGRFRQLLDGVDPAEG